MYFNYMSYTVPSDREIKKKKKSPPLSPYSHTNSLSTGFAYENDHSQLPSNHLDEFFSFDICFAAPLKEELD